VAIGIDVDAPEFAWNMGFRRREKRKLARTPGRGLAEQ